MATTTAAPGLAVAATDPIRSFLSSAAASVDLDTDLRDLAADLTSDPAVPYRSLRAIWCATTSDTRPPLRDLLQGADFVLPSPKPREKVLSLCPWWHCLSRSVRIGKWLGFDSDLAWPAVRFVCRAMS
jgi:hypothetical protein